MKKIVMFEGGVETLAYFSKQMAEQFVKMGYAVFFYNLKDEKLQVLFEQMLDFTGFSGTRILNLPLAYHSFFRYIKFAIRSISSVSVLSRTWQYRSIVICKEL